MSESDYRALFVCPASVEQASHHFAHARAAWSARLDIVTAERWIALARQHAKETRTLPDDWAWLDSERFAAIDLPEDTYHTVILSSSTDVEGIKKTAEAAINLATDVLAYMKENGDICAVSLPAKGSTFADSAQVLRRRLARGIVDIPREEIATSAWSLHPYFGCTFLPKARFDWTYKLKGLWDHRCEAHIDEMGFRNDAPLPKKKGNGIFTIGLFGGSVAMSAGSSSNKTTIPAILEETLNERKTHKNGGVSITSGFLPATSQCKTISS